MHHATTAADLNSTKHFLTFLFFGSGVLFILVGLPLAKRKVKPNGAYGYRTAKTLSNHELWYAANETSGKGFIISGVVVALASVCLLSLPFLIYAIILVIALLGGTGLTTFVAWYKHLRN